ncbi:adenylate/guanylate cyclase domain-containing protein [Sinorhizobium sp. BG8]|uniref:adenylate/guanylate cyclase domain-containing protein n=1 Tax=Sinorhizobium sp. BG8 TaxID=2613773 RepID=UPI00193D4A0E|nr:adenylate/guanylate cyclase domain-containing protein [Sinorhizobium sp. BG8]QRM56202.1 adenylate/guanylate cyclase domain-containing protein [Sinorhizobium sp. BG8]
MERKLAVILAGDVAGYSRLVADNEEEALSTLAIYGATIGDLITEHGGRIFGSSGDSVVAEFHSAVHGVRAAVAIQRALQRHNADLAPDRRMEFRLGLNLGDVVVEGDNLLGDGVNVAARLQEVALPTGICISGSVHEQIEGKLGFPMIRLGDRNLKNIPRPVPVYRVEWRNETPVEVEETGGLLALPDKPSIAVLPFINMSGDPEQEYFADGLTEDIITALSLYRWFFVIARNSSFSYKGRAVDVKQIGRELGVRYIIEGSVRRAGSRLRVTGQLIEAETGVHLWAQRYDRELTDIFAIQDELTQNVVGAIEPEIQIGESRRASLRATDNLDAYECHMRGTWLHNAQDSAEHFAMAIKWHRRAIELDPKFGRAYMMLARSLYARSFHGYSDDVARDCAELCAAAERAISLDERDPYSHYVMCLAHFAAKRAPAALAAAQRAIDLNPNLALAHMALGWARIFTGHFAEVLDPLNMALRLSPHDPLTYLFLNRVSLAHYHLGNYEEAIHYSQRALSLRPAYSNLVVLLASLGQLGRKEEARKMISEFAVSPPPDMAGYWDIFMAYVDPEHHRNFLEGLEKAGVSVGS